MAQPATAPATPTRPRRRRRLLLFVALALLLPCLGTVAYFYVATRLADRRLRAAEEELDRTDPGWRYTDLEAGRKPVPEDVNSAPRVLAARKLMPADWPSPAFDKLFEGLPPERALNEYQAAKLAEEMERLKPALTEARKLKDFPTGRYQINYGPDPMATLLPHVQESRAVVKLLADDATHRANAGDADGAVQSCQAAFNVARSFGDEAFLITLLVRVAERSIALRRLERVLAQGEAAPAALATLQRLLEEEEKEPLMYYALRGERAYSHAALQRLRSGKANFAALAGPTPLGRWKLGPLSLEDILAPILYGSVGDNATANLRFMTRFIEAARKPPEEQYPLFQEWEATIPSQPFLVRLMAPALAKVAEGFRRGTTEVRCAIAMLAVERYRLDRGRWPERLDELVGKYLAQVPTDLYASGPLRFRRLEDRVVIYSVGQDGKDDGGNVDPRKYPPPAPGSDLGFRLWDVGHRRQAPLQPAVGPPFPPPDGPDEPDPAP